MPITATKSSTGHLLGAAGALVDQPDGIGRAALADAGADPADAHRWGSLTERTYPLDVAARKLDVYFHNAGQHFVVDNDDAHARQPQQFVADVLA